MDKMIEDNKKKNFHAESTIRENSKIEPKVCGPYNIKMLFKISLFL